MVSVYVQFSRRGHPEGLEPLRAAYSKRLEPSPNKAVEGGAAITCGF